MKKLIYQICVVLSAMLVLLTIVPSLAATSEMAVVACPEGGVVQFVDLQSNTVLDQVQVGLYPANLVVDNEGLYAYIVGALSFDVTVLNLRSKQIEDAIPVGFVPTGLALTPDGKKLLVANSVKGAPSGIKDITIISTVNRRVIGSVETPGTPADVAVTPDGKWAITTEPLGGIPIWGVGRIALANGTVSIIDLATETTLYTLDLGFMPVAIAVHPSGNYCYVANTIGDLDLGALTAQGVISVVDLSVDPPAVVGTVNTGPLSGPTDLLVTPDGSKLLVSLGALSKVVCFSLADPANPVIIGAANVGMAPMGLAISSDGAKLMVANALEDSYTILNVATNPPAVTATITDIGDVGPLVPAIVPKSVTTLVEYVPAESLPIDFNLLEPLASVDLNYDIDIDLADVTDAYLELSFYDLDWTTEAEVLLNGTKINLPKDIVVNNGWREKRIRVDKSLLLAGANVLTVSDKKDWPVRFILGTAKIILAVPTTGSGSGYTAQNSMVALSTLPNNYRLHDNFPNPFNPTTRIQFEVPESGHIVLTIRNMMGQVVRTLLDAEVPAGQHSIVWQGVDDLGRKVASGTYIYSLESNGKFIAKRMLLMK